MQVFGRIVPTAETVAKIEAVTLADVTRAPSASSAVRPIAVARVAVHKMKLIKADLQKDFVMPLKSNRNVALSEQDKKDARYQAVETLALEHGKAQEVYLEQVNFPLLLVKQVFTNKDNSQGLLYLVSSDTTLDGDQMMRLYQERWQVEEYHNSLKQNASLACSPTRTKRTQTNHFFLSLCAFVKLETLKIKTQCGHFALKQKLYLAALQAAFGQWQTLQPSNLRMSA